MAFAKMQPYILNANAKTMTVILDLNNPDPTTWATYADDAVGMTAGSDAWDAFFGHYPCILENGAELGKLKRSNFAQYEDGTSAPITTLGKDVMICFPRRGIKIEYTDSSHLSISMTDENNKEGYSYMAHSYKGNDCNKIYYGVYKGYASGNKLYSVSGQTPTVSQTIGTFRTWAQARGAGYEQSTWYSLILRQVMYVLKYKGQNPQIVIGRGFVNGSSIYGNTGYTNDKGIDWGESTGKYPMCLFGLEDFYGNIREFIDGIYSNANRQLLAADGNYNDTASGYSMVSSASSSSNRWGFLRYPVGNNGAGFAILVTNSGGGSDSTYFCDSVGISANKFCSFGGNWSNSNSTGLFDIQIAREATNTAADVGSRLMYMHVA